MDQKNTQYETRRGELPSQPCYLLTSDNGSQYWWKLQTWSWNVDKQYVKFSLY